MNFLQTPLMGAFVIEPECVADHRGFFARTYCREKFAERGLNPNIAQCNISYNKTSGTLRGMHYQKAPYEEVKLVRCTNGAIYDVIIDLRPESQSFRKWFGVILSAQNRRALYIPEGFAHGFVTLVDEVEVLYQMSEFYHAESASGVRWDDPVFSIHWPVQPSVISEKDMSYPDYNPSLMKYVSVGD